MKKAAIYTRVSSEEQVQGYSLDAQVDAIREYCESKGYEVAGEYVDGGYTGRNDKRPQFKKLIADAQEGGRFEAVIVHKFDRFARNRAQSVIHKALLRDLGIPVLSVMEPTDPDNPSSIITEGMLEVLAEWYSANLGQEVRKGKTKGAKLGRWMGGFIKYGYKVNDDGYHVINETEAKHVLNIFQKADSGMPLRQIVLWLHNEGIPTKRPGQWTQQRLSLMLKDQTYIGKGFFNKKRRKGNKLVEGEPIAVPFPKIVSEELFNRVRARLAENKKKNNGGAKHFYLLQNLGKCGECGGNLRCHTVGKHRYIGCSRQHTYPHYDCYKPGNWKLGWIEDFVWAEVEDILHTYRNATSDLLIDRFESASSEREQQITTAKQHMEDLKWEKQRILTTIRKGYVTEAEAELQFAAIKSELDYWERELSSLQTLQADSEAAAEKFVVQLKQLDKLFDWGGIWFLTSEQKKQVLNTLLKEFVLYRDGKIELRFKLPVNEKQVAETIASLSSDSVLYDRVKLVWP